MATNASPEHSGSNVAERAVSSTLRAVSDVFYAIAEGIRVRDDYRVRLSYGDEPAKAAAAAVRYAGMH